MADTRIENIVATARLSGPLDCGGLATRLSDVQYVPDRFDGLILKRERATVLVFASGTAKVTGPKSDARAIEVLEGVRKELSAAGVNVADRVEMEFENVVLSHDLGSSLRLHQVALALDDVESVFDPESFPGIVVRPNGTDATLLVFASGSVVVTECRDTLVGVEAIQLLSQQLVDKGLLVR